MGFREIGASDRDVFFAAAFDSFVITLLHCPEVSLGTLQRSLSEVAILRGNFILAEEALGALVVEFFLLQIGLRIERTDGTASILAMHCDNGVNGETTYCQIAADELGLRLEDVFYRPQTDPGFFAMVPDSSTNLSINGFAVRHAARKLKRLILDAATRPTGVTQRGSFPARFPGYCPEDLDLKESVIFVKADPSIRMSLRDFVRASSSLR